MAQDIRKVTDIESLMTYFSEKLGWDIDLNDFYDIDDITYDFEAADLGLKEEAFAKITSLKQLRPLVDDQRWGIFFVDFESDRFEVSALRKILSGLVPARRNADHAVWDKSDLLFLCTWGQQNKVTIGAAHFEDVKKGLPQIKMISCEPAVEDFTQINVFEQRLSKLAWPNNPSDTEAWHDAWASAFTVRYRQTIQDSHTLTVRLAEEAQNIRDRILSTLEIETNNGYVHLLFDKFRDTLIHDMTEQQFADMYAQTIVYGLFSARCMDDSQDDFSAAEAVECIPNTNPFLKSLMQECLGTSTTNSKLSFDELEVGNIVELLLHTRTEAIISDFNRQTGGGREDPVIHFYEEFLTEYDRTQRVQRGVYYTPQPVVNFIVRAVDDILKTEFGVVDGLASTITKTIKYMRESKKKVNGFRTQVEDLMEVPAIQILDPSTGTGTFLRQTILQIYHNFCANRKSLSKEQVRAEWNAYVPQHLLPRLNGFELMMAPYAVAHMKLAMVLKDTGYQFDSNERLRVYLTNSLEEPGNSDSQLTLFDDPLAFESVSANAVKKNIGINVVIGNPPYSGESANKGPWIMDMMESYKVEPGGTIRLQERNPKWLNDDYVKFIRYAQSIIDRAGAGILSYICPHGFIDNPTFRGMRWCLLRSFSKIYIIDLHGNAKKREIAPDGSKDENVFDIQQGVCIILAIKAKGERGTRLADVFHTDLYGLRSQKYDLLHKSTLSQLAFNKVSLIEPQLYFVPKSFSDNENYMAFMGIDELFRESTVGMVSARDKLCIQDSAEQIKAIVEKFVSLGVEDAREAFGLGKDVRDWTVQWAQDDLRRHMASGKAKPEYITKIDYRPFVSKYTYYTGESRGFHCYPRYETMQHFIGHQNIGLCLTKIVKTGKTYQHCFVTDSIIDSCYVSNRTSEITYVMPLFLYDNGSMIEKRPNFTDAIKNFEAALGRRCSLNGEAGTFSPETLLAYIYAILNSPAYRLKYSEQLKVGYPRVPFPSDDNSFYTLAKLGQGLIDLHLGKTPPESLGDYVTTLSGHNVIGPASFGSPVIYLNKRGDCVSGVSQQVWDFFIGSYQPAQKWFKDNKGKPADKETVNTLIHILGVINDTMNIQAAIDKELPL